MSRLKLCGFETGDASELFSLTGTASIQSTVKRTGSYALRTNPTGGTGRAVLRAPDATGVDANLDKATVYFRTYLRIDTLPGSTITAISLVDTASVTVIDVRLSSSGTLQLRYENGGLTNIGSASSALSTGTWYRVEVKAANVTGSATVELKIDGVVVATGTALTVGTSAAIRRIQVGESAGTPTYDIYWDDIAIDDAAYPGAGQVNILKPNATGTTSAWTNGAGTSPTNVAEVPHDSDTSYIRSATISDETTVNLDSSATGGVSGTIAAVQVVGIVRDEGGASGVSVRAFNSGNYDIGTTTVDPGSTYTALSKIFTTDPNTSAAWTTSGLDALEIGVRNMASVAVRCTALYAMVECTGSVTTQVTPSTLSLTTSLQTPTVLTPQYARPASLANTITLQTPTAIITQPVTPAKLSLVTATFAPAVVLKTIVTPAIVALILNSQTPVLFVITTFKTSAILEAQYADSQTFAANYAYSGIFEAQYADSQTLEVA